MSGVIGEDAILRAWGGAAHMVGMTLVKLLLRPPHLLTRGAFGGIPVDSFLFPATLRAAGRTSANYYREGAQRHPGYLLLRAEIIPQGIVN